MLTAILVLAFVDVTVNVVALVRQISIERRLHQAIKHPTRVYGPVK